jgi:UDP-3-O-acyl N-acetylglucosamine deacetylase
VVDRAGNAAEATALVADAGPAREDASPTTPRRIPQRTIGKSVVVNGQGLHSGVRTGLILQPLPAGSGIVFESITTGETVPALVDYVESTGYATTLVRGAMAAKTVEHLMAALHAYGITNLLVKMHTEVPILDGSAQELCELLAGSGVEEQGTTTIEELVVDQRYAVGGAGADEKGIAIEPCDGFEVQYTLDYPAPIGRQEYRFRLDGPESFVREIAPARTFGFVKEIEMLERMGLAAGGRLNNFILVGDDGVVNAPPVSRTSSRATRSSTSWATSTCSGGRSAVASSRARPATATTPCCSRCSGSASACRARRRSRPAPGDDLRVHARERGPPPRRCGRSRRRGRSLAPWTRGCAVSAGRSPHSTAPRARAARERADAARVGPRRQHHVRRGGVRADAVLARDRDERSQPLEDGRVDAADQQQLADGSERAVRRLTGRHERAVVRALGAVGARDVVGVRPVGDRVGEAWIEPRAREQAREHVRHPVEIEPPRLVLDGDDEHAVAERLRVERPEPGCAQGVRDVRARGVAERRARGRDARTRERFRLRHRRCGRRHPVAGRRGAGDRHGDDGEHGDRHRHRDEGDSATTTTAHTPAPRARRRRPRARCRRGS